MRRVTAVVLLVMQLSLFWPPRQADAAMAVFDAAAVTQLIASVRNLTQILGLNVRDLSALSNLGPLLALATEIADMASHWQTFLDTLTALSERWGILTDDDNVPCTPADKVAWHLEAAQLARRGTQEVWQLHRLLRESTALLQSLVRILQLIPVIAGTTSGLQTVGGLVGHMSAEMKTLQLEMATVQAIMTGAEAIERVTVLMDECMMRGRMGGWGQY